MSKEELQKLLESMWDELVYTDNASDRVKMIFEDKVKEFDLDGSFLYEEES